MADIPDNHDDDLTQSMGERPDGPDRPRIEKLGPFRIESTLGSGGMGTIYKAYDESMKRQVALKVLHSSLEISERAQTRFVREAWIAGQLDHPNIIKVLSRGEENNISYLAMELADGGSLYDLIKQTREQIPPDSDVTDTIDQDYIKDILAKFIELSGALEHIHAKGFIHRDVKPHNVLLSGPEKTFKFTDFGIAHAGDMTRMTRAGDFIGTVRYMSPELLAAHRAGIDNRTDIYSLGVTLYETLTLTLPFKADSEEKLIGEILAGHYTEARKINRRIPVDLETVLTKACHYDPSQRYQTAAEFAEDLQRIIDGRPILAKRPGLLTKGYKYLKRNYKETIGIAVGVALIATIAVWAYYKVERAYDDYPFIIQQTVGATDSEPTFTKIDVPGKTEYCALSPDGERIAFVATDKCLWVAPTRGPSDSNSIGEPKRLTGPIAPNTLGSIPTWSADGKWIAFNGSGTNEDRWADTLAIYVVSSSGGDLQRLPILHDLWDAYFDLRISLSPDGKEVAFFSHTSPFKADTVQNCIYTAPVGGGEIRRLVGPSCGQPAYSPDGKMLAYVKGDLQPWASSDSTQSEVWVVPAEGGIPIQVSDVRGIVFSPTWSPDSKMIAFGKWEDVGDGYAINRLYVIQLSDKYEPIGSPVEIDLPLWWDGYHLCGWSDQNSLGLLLWSPSERDEAIYRVASSGGIATKVTAESGFAPKWSHDGKSVFYIINDSIRSISLAGATVTGVPLQGEYSIRPFNWDISPDGESLIFPAGVPPDSIVRIYTVPINGGTPAPLMVSDTVNYICPEHSLDGKWISLISYYESNSGTQIRLCVMSTDDSVIRELASHDNCVSFSIPHKSWSPDSKRIAYASCTKDSSVSIRMISVDGSDQEHLHQLSRDSRVNSIDWSPDGKYLCYTAGWIGPVDERQRSNVWILSLETGELTKLQTGLDMEWVDDADWSPDGSQILFHCDWSGSSDFYLMEDFLPSVIEDEPEPPSEPAFSMIDVPGLLDYCALSPDGKQIAYAADDSCLWVAPTRGKADSTVSGESVRLTGPVITYQHGSLPVWSADGNWIAFNASGYDSAGSYWSSMHVIRSTGGKVIDLPIKHDREHYLTFYDYRLSLSPDGKEIAFYSHTSPITDDSQGDCIYATPVNGGEVRRLVELPDGDSSFCAHPAYSSDGRMIAFLKGNRQCGLANEAADCDIWVVPAGGGVAMQVTDMPGVEFGPVWSPDGTKMAYNTWSGYERETGYDVKELSVIELDGNCRQVGPPAAIKLPLPADDFISGWTTNNEIGVVSETRPHMALYTVAASGGVATMVRPSRARCPSWSSDGESVVYLSSGSVYSASLASGDESVIPITGLQDVGYEGGCDLSPDGNSIVLNAQKAGDTVPHIYTVTSEGGSAKQLTYGPGEEWFPRWSPDGSQVAFSREVVGEESAFDLVIVSTEDGSTRVLVPWTDSCAFSDGLPDWSPDGKYVAYPSIFNDSARGICLVPSEGGVPEVLLKLGPGQVPISLRWSPDGTRIAYTVVSTGFGKKSAEVWILPLDSRHPKMLQILAQDLDGFTRVDWSPDSQKLIFEGYRMSRNSLCLIKDFL